MCGVVSLLLLWVGGVAVSPSLFGALLFPFPGTVWRCCLLPPHRGGAAVLLKKKKFLIACKQLKINQLTMK